MEAKKGVDSISNKNNEAAIIVFPSLGFFKQTIRPTKEINIGPVGRSKKYETNFK
jgi:hypothetical protein